MEQPPLCNMPIVYWPELVTQSLLTTERPGIAVLLHAQKEGKLAVFG